MFRPLVMRHCKTEIVTLDDILSMSHEAIQTLAENNPVIPDRDIITALENNYGHSGVIQNYCHQVSGTMNINLPDIPTLIPSQECARENAAYWMQVLNDKILGIYSSLLSFLTFYGALTPEYIDKLVDDIGTTPGGKETFILFMNTFKDESEKHGEKAKVVTEDLLGFSKRLYQDLRNFQIIKVEADALYIGENGKLKQLQNDMANYEDLVSNLNIAIGVLSAAIVIGIVLVVIGKLLSPTVGGALIAAGIAVSGTASGLLKKYIDERRDNQQKYSKAAVEFDQLEKHCAVLQALANDFDSLAGTNELASLALNGMISSWQIIGQNFSGIIESIKDIETPLDPALALITKLRLKGALDMVKALRDTVVEYQKHPYLDVKPEDEAVIHICHLPPSWLNQRIPGQVYFNTINSKRNNGFYNRRGRLKWYTRSDFIMSYPTRSTC